MSSDTGRPHAVHTDCETNIWNSWLFLSQTVCCGAKSPVSKARLSVTVQHYTENTKTVDVSTSETETNPTVTCYCPVGPVTSVTSFQWDPWAHAVAAVTLLWLASTVVHRDTFCEVRVSTCRFEVLNWTELNCRTEHYRPFINKQGKRALHSCAQCCPIFKRKLL